MSEKEIIFYKKLREATLASLELGFFPIRKLKKIPIKNTKSFSDGKDIGSWIKYQERKYKANLLTNEEEKMFRKFLELGEQLVPASFCLRIEEAEQLIKTKESMNDSSLKFSDGTSLKNWIVRVRERKKRNLLTKGEECLFNNLLNNTINKGVSENKLFNERVIEILKLIEKNKITSFEDIFKEPDLLFSDNVKVKEWAYRQNHNINKKKLNKHDRILYYNLIQNKLGYSESNNKVLVKS